MTRCVPLQASEDPIATAAAFIRTAVETAGGTGQLVLNVTLVSREKRGQPARFLLELRQDGARWRVGFCDRVEHA